MLLIGEETCSKILYSSLTPLRSTETDGLFVGPSNHRAYLRFYANDYSGRGITRFRREYDKVSRRARIKTDFFAETIDAFRARHDNRRHPLISGQTRFIGRRRISRVTEQIQSRGMIWHIVRAGG